MVDHFTAYLLTAFRLSPNYPNYPVPIDPMKRLVDRQDACILSAKTQSRQYRWWRSTGTLAMAAILALGNPMGLIRGKESTAMAQTLSITPNPNLTINGTCAPNIKIALILDASQSIDDTELGQMKAGIISFLNNLATKAPDRFQVGIVEFGLRADLLRDFTSVNPTTTNASGTFTTDMNTRFPDRKTDWSSVNIDIYTNWEAGFQKAYDTLRSANLVIFITDGNPNSYLDGSGSPVVYAATATPTPAQAQVSINETIPITNLWKSQGTKIIAVGVAEVAPNIPDNFQEIADDSNTLLFSSSPNNIATADYLSISSFSNFGTQIGNLGTGKSFKITTLPTNGTLYYPNASNVPVAVTLNQIITNYDPTKLTIDPTSNATSTVTFQYAAIDAANREDLSPATVSMPFTSNASVLLVKRITAINGVAIDRYRDNTANIPQAVNDNNIYWPLPLNSNASKGNTNISTFLRGEIDVGQVKPGDTVEYTIYFLNPGGNNANNVSICDRIIGKQTLNGTQIQLHKGDGTSNFTAVSNLTSTSDGDRATLSAAGVTPSRCNFNGVAISQGKVDNGTISVDITGASANPIVWSSLAASTAAGTNNAYGFIRFTTKVDP